MQESLSPNKQTEAFFVLEWVKNVSAIETSRCWEKLRNLTQVNLNQYKT
jgi:hypothetical protein